MADVGDFEPRLALDGGADGLDLVRRIVDAAPIIGSPAACSPSRSEWAKRTQRRRLEARGLTEVRSDRDYAKIERVVSGVWQ